MGRKRMTGMQEEKKVGGGGNEREGCAKTSLHFLL